MKKLDLGKDNINKLLLAFSIPCIISMLINSVYNIVDQIFIGQGVGTIGNAATNVLFPLVMLFGATAGLIGNGSAAGLSLRLGEGNKKEASKMVGTSIVMLVLAGVLIAVLGEIFLPVLVRMFGCTDNVYSAAMTYGRIILLGAPLTIIYSGLSSIIRADGSPKYAMVCLVIGAVINIILDPIFIFGFKMGVAGGAWATVIGQFVSFIIGIVYIKKIKSVKLEKSDYKLGKDSLRVLGLGLSSFITQVTVLVLFIVMNNLMSKFGATSKFGADIPLSGYGIVSKINSFFISFIIGFAIGAQPIIGYNYGSGNFARVKETMKKLITISLSVGIIYNILILVFPEAITSLFITKSDPNYKLFMEFSVDCFRIFLMVCGLNALEMCSSVMIQSLGKVKKATALSFTRQIILFIPIAIILCNIMGLYGALYAGVIADSITFVLAIILITSEFRSINKLEKTTPVEEENVSTNVSNNKSKLKEKVVITINREYGSGGRYVGELLAKELGIPCYDKEMVHLTAKESGFRDEFVSKNEETTNAFYENNDTIFIAETKVTKDLAKNSCVIVGRCADYALRNNKNKVSIFIYSDDKSKIERAVKYYGLKKTNALKTIKSINKERAKHYKYYTDTEWNDFSNYDLAINSDVLGVEETAKVIKDFVEKKFN